MRENKSAKEGVVNFEFTNQVVVKSLHWGKNRILFMCGKFQEIIEVHQRK